MYYFFLEYESYRAPLHGTPFIQALSAVLRENGTDNHLLELLTAVNFRMSNYNAVLGLEDSDQGEGKSENETDGNQVEGKNENEIVFETDARGFFECLGNSSELEESCCKQMPNFYSTLTGLVYFRPKNT